MGRDSGVAGSILAAIVGVIVAIAIVIGMAVTGLAWIYVRRAIRGRSTVAILLWIAALVFLPLMAYGSWLVQFTAFQREGLYLTSWCFLSWVGIAMLCETYEESKSPRPSMAEIAEIGSVMGFRLADEKRLDHRT